jgi:DNA polymerase-3 subunit epsilon
LVVLDFETANGKRNSACAIGLVKIRNRQIIQQASYLIRPPSPDFAPINVEIHGITWNMVKAKPTFGQLWPQLDGFWADATFLVAHNAPFDHSVLEACCNQYDLRPPEREFLCTVQIARQCWPDLENHKLPTVCKRLRIDLQHHDACSDALASAKILLAAMAQGYPS